MGAGMKQTALMHARKERQKHKISLRLADTGGLDDTFRLMDEESNWKSTTTTSTT